MKVIPFGKYVGRRWTDIASEDPGYLNWLIITYPVGSSYRLMAQEALSSLMPGTRDGREREGSTRPPQSGERRACRKTTRRRRRSGMHP